MLYFSGIQPTGKLHIGNYLGAIKNWVNLQQQGRNIYCIVDYHALTDKFKIDHKMHFPQNIKTDTISLAATLIASGIDNKKSIFFLQSHVPEHAELQWLLSCVAPQNWLNKMTQYKDKKSNNSTLGLFTYPVLMASDIILYQATDIPVGLDQKQHVELARDYVLRMNQLFDLSLVMPNYVESSTPKIMSLRDAQKKMSKSEQNDYSRINISDSKELIHDKLRKAKTDSINQIYYDQEQRPEISNILRIYSAFSQQSLETVIQKYQNSNIQELKEDLSKLISDELNPIAEKSERLLENERKIMDILIEGGERARMIAQQNIMKIKKSMGILTF